MYVNPEDWDVDFAFPNFNLALFYECVNTVQSTFHVVLCLLYTYRDIHHFGGLFILNLSKILKFAATHLPQNDNENEVSAFW